jgi:hypothetical protein
MNKLSFGGVLAALSTTTALLVGTPVAPSAAAPPFCAGNGLTTYLWQPHGLGDGISWGNPQNWSTDRVPGRTPGGGTDFVCLDNAGTITMTGDTAELVAFDMRGTTLTMLAGSKLFVYGAQATRPARIRQGASIVMTGGNAIGGPGRINVSGLLRMNSIAGLRNAMSTRICGIDTISCGGPVLGARGLLSIEPSGTLRINGGSPGLVNLGGVDLKDQYQIQVSGTMELAQKGFVSADYGTATQLLPQAAGVGRLVIKNNGGYYIGGQFFGLPTPSTFTNDGLVLKSSGSGTSAIAATYSAPTGDVTVNAGKVVLPDGPATPSRVGAGFAIGSGLCPLGFLALSCEPPTTSTDVQITTVRLSLLDLGGATVAFHEEDSLASPDDVAPPVQIDTTGLQATPLSPAILSLQYDASILEGQHVADLTIFRQEGTAPYTQVPDCRLSGTPPPGQTACVDRRGIIGVSSRDLPDGDALMIVRTQGTSRWVAR